MAVKIEMEMPKSCRECKFYEFISSDYTKVYCPVIGYWTHSKKGERSLECPLQEVKE
jgi:hypothetical protein